VITGAGANVVTVSGNNAVEVFAIFSGVTATLTGLTISGGSGFEGGGIYNEGTLTVSSSTINNDSGFEGGGICNLDTLTITNSTVDSSSADDGGGIFSYLGGTLTVTNCTIDNNRAGYSGGGIDNGGAMTVTNSTIAYCSAAYYGGGISNSGTVTLDNTIVALNGADISGPVSSTSAYNQIGTGGSGGLVNGVNGNLVGVADPGLDPNGLQNNGGPTETIALLAGSPAIDAGSNALAVDPTTGQPLTTDQRGPGFPRIVNGTVDIGAFEFSGEYVVVTAQPPPSVTAGSNFGLTVTAENGSGDVDSSFNGTVTVAIANNPGGSVLGGTLTATAQNGVASFSDLTLNKTGTGYTLLLSGSGIGTRTTAGVIVTAAAATQVVVTTQPPFGVAVGSGFGLVVSAEDPFGNVDPDFNGSVAVALLNNPGGATLGGIVTTTVQNGVATFSGLTLNNAGIGYTLQVSTNGLTAANTNAFNVQTTIATFGVGWGTQTAALQTASDGLRLLPAGRNTDMPWLGINQLPITLAQATSMASGDVTVSSAIGVNYGPVTVSGSGTNYTITLAQPITKPDRVTITIGNATIATFTRRLDVLPGDFNDDGVVNSQDIVGVRNEWLRINGAVPTIFGDINGDGFVNVTDYNDVGRQVGTRLPSVSDTSIAAAAPHGGPELVRIGTNGPSQRTVASRARPRAEVQLSGRGWILGTLTRGKLINQRLIERS